VIVKEIAGKMEDAEEVDRLRKVEPSANESRGRSIPMILYDRSIRGPSGVGGRQHPGRGTSRSMPYAMHASPSSVIPRHHVNEGDGTIESISSVLKSETESMQVDDTNTTVEAKSLEADANSSSKPVSNSAAPILDNVGVRRPSPPPPPPPPPPQQPSTTPLKFNAFPTNHTNEIRNYGEQYSVTKFNWGYLHLRPKEGPSPNVHQPQRLQRRRDDNTAATAISTISIAFSPDGRTMASTHGDHSVKITCCHTGAFVRELNGHPRTPWTVKYHPIRSNIVASGCLGYQVRVWDWNHIIGSPTHDNTEDEQYNYHDKQAVLINMIRLNCAIISLSFHPTGSILAVASGQTLHLWNYDAGSQDETNATRSSHTNDATDTTRRRRGRRTEMRYEHNLRCVHFPPSGTTIIVGGANPPLPPAPAPDGAGTRGGDASYSLKLFDFDLEAALNPHLYLGEQQQRLNLTDATVVDRLPFFRRETLSNPRTFLHRALLYNDGGFDVSPDGKMLCGCAEIFLPHGVKSAMENTHTHEDHKMRQGSQVTDEEDMSQDSNNDSTNISEETTDVLREDVPSLDEIETTISIPDTTRGEHSLTSPARERETLEECKTPPNTTQTQIPTTPPSPPGRRWSLQLSRNNSSSRRIQVPSQGPGEGQSQNHAPPPPPLPPSRYLHANGMLQNSGFPRGRFVPHVVVVSLDVNGSLGQLIEATPLGSKASSVTCVKFSPSAEFCLLGYGVRENAPQIVVEHNYHPVSAVYRVRGGMKHIVTMLSGDDDVNIARFHPESGHGFVYGTKQGRVRVLSPWAWNYYYD